MDSKRWNNHTKEDQQRFEKLIQEKKQHAERERDRIKNNRERKFFDKIMNSNNEA